MANGIYTDLRPVNLLLEGMLIGATLVVMIGPITFTILDASLSGGIPRGAVTAFGMWCSDALYIGLCYFGAQQLRLSMQSEDTVQMVSLIGGVVLITIGVLIWTGRHRLQSVRRRHPVVQLPGHWLRGFMVNTFAPFSIFFWPTVTLTLVIPRAVSTAHAASFYVGVMAVIITGDMLKTVFAAWISRRIPPSVVVKIRVLLALLFLVAGVVVLGRVLWNGVY